MAGIYIHIPFCRQKCNYCNFYSLASTKYKDEVFEAILQELMQRKDFLANETVETLYIGGGTPSLINATEMARLIDQVGRYYDTSVLSEITIEANPEDITSANLSDWGNAGINRLSIGVQSFRQEDLDFLNRPHTTQQIEIAIIEALNHGFSNLSIDLIYGIPTLNNFGWEANLYHAFSFAIPHISAYSLTVEQNTPLDLFIKKGRLPDIDENRAVEQYHILTRVMKEQGFEHYEISNFCQTDAYSKHNTSYWQKKNYLGIGPSAHSFKNQSRSWNISNLKEYIDSVKAGKVISESEELTLTDQFNEYIMTSLRTLWGCDLKIIREKFGMHSYNQLLHEADLYIKEGKLLIKAEHMLIPPEWRLFTDGIASSLFSLPEEIETK